MLFYFNHNEKSDTKLIKKYLNLDKKVSFRTKPKKLHTSLYFLTPPDGTILT